MVLKHFVAPFLTFLFLALCQKSFFPHFAILGSTLNLVLVMLFVLVFFSSLKDNKIHILRGMTAGLAVDLFSYAPFGVFLLTFSIAAFLLAKISAPLQKTSIISCLASFSLFFIFFNAFSFALLALNNFAFKADFVLAANLKNLLTGFIVNLLFIFILTGLARTLKNRISGLKPAPLKIL